MMQLWWNICCREGNRFDNTEGWIITREIEGHALLNVSAPVAHMAEGIMLKCCPYFLQVHVVSNISTLVVCFLMCAFIQGSRGNKGASGLSGAPGIEVSVTSNICMAQRETATALQLRALPP